MRHPAAVLFALTLSATIALADDPSIRTSSDGLTTELGSAAAGATHKIAFTVVQSDVEHWPQPVTVTIKASGSTHWTVALGPRVATKPHVLRTAAGAYDITFEAPHYRPLTRSITVAKDDVDLGTLTMNKLPVLSGSVRASDGSPVVGAFVDDGNDHTGKTDATGLYSIEINDRWPSRLQVSYPGYATAEIPVPKVKATHTMPLITMSRGGRLEVTVTGSNDARAIDLEKATGFQHYELLRTATLSQGVNTVTFPDLVKAEYVLVVRAEGPLQKLSTVVNVGENEVTAKEIRIEPFTAHIEVRRGEKPVPGAFVHLSGNADSWSSDVRAGDDGNYTAEAWERGPYGFAVRVSEAAPPLLILDDIQGKTEATVHLSVPDRKISGQVTDAESGAAVPKATIFVRSQNDDDTGGSLKVVADDDGKFTIDSIRDGAHTIFVDTEGYIRSDPRTIRIDESVPQRVLDLKISKGLARPIRVVTRAGAPIAGALVIETVNQTVTGSLTTDQFGRTIVHSPERQSAVIYIVPQEGSFAIVRLPSSPAKDEQVITVSDGTAMLELHAMTTSGKPLPDLRFVMRFDGEMIPGEVAETLELQRGVSPVTDADGVAHIDKLPPGFMELWPIRDVGSEPKLIAAGGGSAPVQVSLKDGLNVAKITFAPK